VAEIVMPQFGETVEEEITITRWLKTVGEHVEAGEPLLEVETDKATLSVEAADSGTLERILVKGGQAVKPGTIIGHLGD
jgi:pyruvate/2-oxoglutarate dehydrogenase complex dihydrolipoamide acyltransferase (E2) component